MIPSIRALPGAVGDPQSERALRSRAETYHVIDNILNGLCLAIVSELGPTGDPDHAGLPNAPLLTTAEAAATVDVAAASGRTRIGSGSRGQGVVRSNRLTVTEPPSDPVA
ncbi:hypothetical protein GCM10027605_66680 [Micromonospora zhanjiangensis]